MLNNNKLFWVLQFLGWGAFAAFALYLSKIANNSTGVLIMFFPLLLSGLIATSILRAYLKRFISIDSFRVLDLLKIFISIAVTCFLFAYISYGFGYATGYLSAKFLDNASEIFNKPPNDIKASKYIGYFILIFGWTVFYFGIKFFLKLNEQRIERINLQDSIKQAQLNILRGQVNPKFMINSLKNIKNLMLNDVTASRDMLTKLSEILRYALTKNNVNQVALEEEIEIINNFIDITKINNKNKFSFSKEIDLEVLKAPIPPMLIFSLIEYILEDTITIHQENKVLLSVSKEKDTLIIKVESDVKQENDKEMKLTFNKIKQRLKLIYNDSASSFLKNINTEQIEIIIKLPLERKEAKV